MSGYYPLYVGAAYPASGGVGGGDMVLASVQTVTGAKTFNDSTLLLANVAGTFSSKFTNTNTASRTYTLKDASGTVAFTSDITGTNSGTNTGDQTITLTGAVTGSGTGSFVASLGSFTKSQLDTAVSDANLMYIGDAPTAHVHAATDITTGTLGVARGGTGLTALGTSLQVLRTNAAGTANEYATITAGDALTTNPLSQFAATTSAQLAGVISDETGSDALVFANSPTLVTPIIGVARATSIDFGALSTDSRLVMRGINLDALTKDQTNWSNFRSGSQTISGSLTVTTTGTFSGAVTIGGGTAITKVLSATATLDFPSIASNDTHSLTMTVTGAVAGNAVFIGVPAALDANLIWQASVTAADTVTIRMHNASGASIDPASGTYRATVFQF